jgi:hypothetical protein
MLIFYFEEKVRQLLAFLNTRGEISIDWRVLLGFHRRHFGLSNDVFFIQFQVIFKCTEGSGSKTTIILLE